MRSIYHILFVLGLASAATAAALHTARQGGLFSLIGCVSHQTFVNKVQIGTCGSGGLLQSLSDNQACSFDCTQVTTDSGANYEYSYYDNTSGQCFCSVDLQPTADEIVEGGDDEGGCLSNQAVVTALGTRWSFRACIADITQSQDQDDDPYSSLQSTYSGCAAYCDGSATMTVVPQHDNVTHDWAYNCTCYFNTVYGDSGPYCGPGVASEYYFF